MKAEDIRRVLIIGAGTMGQQISIPCALNGCDVVIYDIRDEILDKAERKVRKILDNMITWKKITADDADRAYSRIFYTTDPAEAAREADILSESVPEDPELKNRIFSQFNRLCPERTIFTTNTSTLLPSKIAAATGRPERFLAFHFHDLMLTTVVDVMPHPGTSKETIDTVAEFAGRIGQSPIVMHKESGGYVFNRMLTALFYEAQSLAANEVATPEDIDRAWMGVTHMFMGPFGMMDSIGIDTIWKISDFWAQKQKDPQGIKNTEFLKQFVDKGETGKKAGKGIYSYPDPAFARPDFVAGKKN